MGKAWRWDKQSFKRTVLDAVLDKVVRELFGDGDRPRQRKTGGGVSPRKKPQRQTFFLEAIEPRLLLSADLSYLSASTEFSLKAVDGTHVRLFDNTATAVGSAVAISDGSLTIERTGGIDHPGRHP